MGQGQKGFKDKKGSKRRDDSPAPEDGDKCRVCRFPLLVALLQLLLGVAVTAVAFLTLAISPSLLARETPHWAGIIVSVCSVHGHCMQHESHFLHNTCMTLSSVTPGDHTNSHIQINLRLNTFT